MFCRRWWERGREGGKGGEEGGGGVPIFMDVECQLNYGSVGQFTVLFFDFF